jgi:hypothetical protein
MSPKEAFWIGGTALALSAGIAAVGYYTIASEEAEYPGQKDFGVGALAILFGAPVLILMVTGLVSMLVGVIFVQRLRPINRNETNPLPHNRKCETKTVPTHEKPAETETLLDHQHGNVCEPGAV